MIVLVWPEANSDGNIVLNELPDSNLKTHARRVSRRATLNGGVYLSDGGLVQGDRTFEIQIKKDKTIIERIEDLQSTFNQYQCITDDGVYNGVISQVLDQQENLTIQFFVKNKEI